MENSIKFKTALLAGFSLITAPGKYALEVLNNVSEKNLFADENGSRYIVTLKAIAPDKVGQVTETFRGQEEVNIEETNGLFLTGSIWKRDGQPEPALPMKGETIEANISYVLDRENNQVLRVTNLRVKAAITASKFTLEAVEVPAGAVLEHQS